MYIEEINRTRSKRFTNGASCAPLMDRGTVEVFLQMLSNEIFFAAGGGFFDALTERFELRNSEVSTVLKVRNKAESGRGDPRFFGGDRERGYESFLQGAEESDCS